MDTAVVLAKAEHQHRQGHLQEAGQIYRSVLANDPQNADACYGLGTILLQQENYQHSHEFLKKATDLQQDVPEFMVNLAMVLEKLERLDEAAESYLKAVELAPDDMDLLIRSFNRLLALGREHDVDGLLRHCDGSVPELSILKARTQSALGNWAGATQTLQAIAQRNPENPDIWRELSTAATRIRDYKTAISAFRKYFLLSPETTPDLLAYADLLLMARRAEDASKVIGRAQQQMPENAQLRLIQAKCARLLGDYENAREHILRAIELAPEMGEAWQIRLEMDPDKSRLTLANDCQQIAGRAKISPRDKIMLELTAGRAFELCGEYERAFSCFVIAKEVQKQQLHARNSNYDPAAAERVMDRIIGLFTAPVRRNPNSQPQPIFILGMPRSGTTLVERIIGEHEGVVTAGENEAMEFIAAQYYWDLEHNRQPVPLNMEEQSWQQMQQDYWRRSNRLPTLVTDKMPHNFRHVGLILSLFPRAPIIYLRRDPRDVCLSIYSRMFPEGHRYACDLQWLAHFYHQSTRIMDYWQLAFPDRILEVKYEELVENPPAFSREIADFCGLNWNPDCLNFHHKPAPGFTFSEMQVRRPINSEGIGRWKHYERQLAPLLKALHEYGEIN